MLLQGDVSGMLGFAAKEISEEEGGKRLTPSSTWVGIVAVAELIRLVLNEWAAILWLCVTGWRKLGVTWF
jgi:hypothetical protein